MVSVAAEAMALLDDKVEAACMFYGVLIPTTILPTNWFTRRYVMESNRF